MVVAYFYFSFNETEHATAAAVLSSLIKQLCCSRPDTPKPIQDLRDYQTKGHRPDLKTLEEILLATIAGFSNVYLVLDALDECPDLNGGRERLLMCLDRIHLQGIKNLHMFWTSRREKDIERFFISISSPWRKKDIDLSVYRPAIDHDIGLYIDRTLSSYNLWPDELKAEARSELIKRADGM